VLPETDALITSSRGVTLMLRFADCVPVLLYDPVRRVAGLAHAGWRGTVSGIARKTVQRMVSHYGCRPEDVLAGVGPSIGPCCYEVGEDVAEAVRDSMPESDDLLNARSQDRWHLDLWRANVRQLAESGVLDIEIAGTCTACRTDEWYSHRAEHGRTGRWGALLGLRACGV
jgi:YfiH family protein